MVAGALLLERWRSVASRSRMQVNKTQPTMKATGKSAGALSDPMVKGEKPYDQAAVDTALAQLDDIAKKLPTLFPESIKGVKLRR